MKLDTLNIQAISDAIAHGNWSNSDLNNLQQAIKFNRAQLQKRVKRNLTIGGRVSWKSCKSGMLGKLFVGTVEKIATKYVTVNTIPAGRWRVPANMLEVL